MKRLKIYLLAGALLSSLGLFAQTGNDQIPTVSSEAPINLQQHSVANQEMNGTDETDVDSKEAQKRKAEAEKAQKKAEKERQKAQKEAEKAQKKAEKEAQKAAEKEQKEAEKEAQRLRKEAEKAQKEAEKAREKAEAAQAKADAAQAKADEEASAPQKQKAGEGAAKDGDMTSEPSVKTNPSGQPEATSTNENTESMARADEQQGNPMQKLHEKNAKEIERLLGQIAQHEDAPVYLLMMAEHVEENWIAKPHSHYSPAKLEMAIRAYERVAEQCDRQDDRQKLQQAAKRLSGLYKDAQLYWDAYEAICSPYDKKMVAPLIPQMQKLRDGVNQKKYPDKHQDLKDLTRQLYFYDAKVDIFKDLIDAFDNALKDAQDVNGRLERLKQEYEEDIDAICENPWLQGQFDEYMKNPLNSPVRATIKGLVTE